MENVVLLWSLLCLSNWNGNWNCHSVIAHCVYDSSYRSKSFHISHFSHYLFKAIKKNCARQHWLDVLSTTYFQKANFKKKIFTLWRCCHSLESLALHPYLQHVQWSDCNLNVWLWFPHSCQYFWGDCFGKKWQQIFEQWQCNALLIYSDTT